MSLVGADVFTTLEQQIEECSTYVTLSDDVAAHAYAPGKWTVREVLGHLIDAERIFAHRAHWIARNGAAPLPGFDEDAFVVNGRFNDRTVHDIALELRMVRMANLALFRSFSDNELRRCGTANGADVDVEAIVWIVAGHALHHAAILHERYLI